MNQCPTIRTRQSRSFTRFRCAALPDQCAVTLLGSIIVVILSLSGCKAPSTAPTVPVVEVAPEPNPSITSQPALIVTHTPTATSRVGLSPTVTLIPVQTTPPPAPPKDTPKSTSSPRLDQAVPRLDSPPNNSAASGRTVFRWTWNGPALAANQAFEVRIWKDGQADHYGAAEPVRTTSLTINVNQASGVQQGGNADYLWTVAAVQVNPYKRIGKEAPPRTLHIDGVPPTPSRSAAPLMGPDGWQRFAGVIGILSGSLLVGWLYLSGAFEAWLRRGRRP